jgi:hypothetical protein
MMASGLVFTTVVGKEWVGYLIFVACAFQMIAMFLVIARSCCYENNQDIVWSGNPASSKRSSSIPVDNSRDRRNNNGVGGQDFGANSPGYTAPTAKSTPTPKQESNQINEDAFGSDNPFGAPGVESFA